MWYKVPQEIKLVIVHWSLCKLTSLEASGIQFMSQFLTSCRDKFLLTTYRLKFEFLKISKSYGNIVLALDFYYNNCTSILSTHYFGTAFVKILNWGCWKSDALQENFNPTKNNSHNSRFIPKTKKKKKSSLKISVFTLLYTSLDF